MFLHRYTQEPLMALIAKYGVKLAYTLEEREAECSAGINYVVLGQGLHCPADSVSEFLKEWDAAVNAAVAKALEENTRESIIEYELKNHECFWTGTVHDAVQALKVYGITRKEVIIVYYAKADQYTEA